MGLSKDSTRVPRLTEGIDIRNLSIDPFEGFILSRIDGVMTAQDVADSTGADVNQVVELVDRLAELGASSWLADRATATPPSEQHKVPPRSSPGGYASRIHTRPPPPGTSLVLYDPAELDEAAELPVERKREILDRYYRIDELNYYELLGIARSADKKEIREAYFSLSKVFHPDTLFGKDLGSYKNKMELVFGALTKAYEVLGKKRKRKDYDLYLGLTDTTKDAEQRLADVEVDAVAAERAAIDAAAAALVMPTPLADPSETRQAASSSKPPPQTTTSSTPPPSTATSNPPPHAASSTPPRSTDERKTRARSRLKHRFQRASESHVVEPPRPPVERSREELLRGLAGSLRSAARITGGVDKAAEQLRAGKEAEERGDLLAATNAYRLALSLNENPETRAEYTRVKTHLAVDLAEKYKKQAQYEEENQKWGAAALSWKKVCEGRPHSVEPLCRAANAILRAGGDLKHARDLAQSAVNMMPGNARCRVTLAQVYIGAGMQKSARGELQEAAKLDPSDEIVKTLLGDLG